LSETQREGDAASFVLCCVAAWLLTRSCAARNRDSTPRACSVGARSRPIAPGKKPSVSFVSGASAHAWALVRAARAVTRAPWWSRGRGTACNREKVRGFFPWPPPFCWVLIPVVAHCGGTGPHCGEKLCAFERTGRRNEIYEGRRALPPPCTCVLP